MKDTKTVILVLSFLFLALSGKVALCETEKEKTRDEYTRLVKLITDYNAGTNKAMSEYNAINFKLINDHNSNSVRLINEYNSNSFRLINRYNLITFTLIMALNTTTFVYVTYVQKHSHKTIADQQCQIDDLKRELEELRQNR